MPEIEFNFRGLPVGCFQEDVAPDQDGLYTYQAYRGPGHQEMLEALKTGGAARCHYDTRAGRRFFDVIAAPDEATLELARFTLATMPQNEAILWMEPWVSAVVGAELELQLELEKEVSESHMLFQCRCMPLARRIDKEEILFRLLDSGDQVAVVSLTWSGKREADERLPATEVYPSLQNWVETRMKRDHAEFMGES